MADEQGVPRDHMRLGTIPDRTEELAAQAREALYPEVLSEAGIEAAARAMYEAAGSGMTGGQTPWEWLYSPGQEHWRDRATIAVAAYQRAAAEAGET